jgi:hypothetical protein
MHIEGHGHKAGVFRRPFYVLYPSYIHSKMVLGKTFMKAAALVAGLAITSDALALRKPNLNELIKPYKRDELLQSLVTWDEHSLFVRGERIMIYSGEFHPFRYETSHA